MPIRNVEAFCRALWRHEDETVTRLAPLVDPNGKDRWGHTPLLMAAQYGESALVALLVGRGAAVDQQREHLTPITFAARRKADDVVGFLRAKGAAESVVTWVYLGEHKHVERELTRDRTRARLLDEEGSPILHHAVEALQPELVDLLLDHGATVSDVDANRETPLHRCADIRQAPQQAAAIMASRLLDRGADVNDPCVEPFQGRAQAVRPGRPT